jgi:hypothetical protein
MKDLCNEIIRKIRYGRGSHCNIANGSVAMVISYSSFGGNNGRILLSIHYLPFQAFGVRAEGLIIFYAEIVRATVIVSLLGCHGYYDRVVVARRLEKLPNRSG